MAILTGLTRRHLSGAASTSRIAASADVVIPPPVGGRSRRAGRDSSASAAPLDGTIYALGGYPATRLGVEPCASSTTEQMIKCGGPRPGRPVHDLLVTPRLGNEGLVPDAGVRRRGIGAALPLTITAMITDVG